MNKSMIKMLLGLHAMLMIYSMSGICSKLAAGEKFLSYWVAAGHKEYSFNNCICKQGGNGCLGDRLGKAVLWRIYNIWKTCWSGNGCWGCNYIRKDR